MTVSPKDFLDKVNNKTLFGFNAFGQKDQLSLTKKNTTQLEQEQIEEATPNPDTKQDKTLLGKVAEKIISKTPKVVSKVIKTKNKIEEKGKEKLGQFVQETAKAAQQGAEQSAQMDKYLSTKADTEAKMSAVDGKYVTSEQKLFNDIANQYLGGVKGQTRLTVFDQMKDIRQSTDGTETYLTNGTHVIKQPTIHTIDTNSIMQSAYNDVTYILANEGRLITSQDLKEMYPEYADIPESSLDRFISACAYDVLEKGERTDLQVFADYFGDISLNDNYTSEKQAMLDLLSDEGFMSLGRDGLYFDEVAIYSTLSAIAQQIKDLGYNQDGASDRGILQSYKDMPWKFQVTREKRDEKGDRKTGEYTIQELLNMAENIDQKALKKKIDGRKERYDTNITNLDVLKKNREENPQYTILRNVAANAAQYVEDRINEGNMKWSQNGLYSKIPDSVIFGNYYVGEDGSYYNMDGSILYRKTTNNVGEEIYVDKDGNYSDITKLKGGFLRSVATTLTQGNVKAAEIPLDVSLAQTANELREQGKGGQYYDISSMYATQVLGDVISAGFSAAMSTPGGLAFQLATQMPGGKVIDWTFQTAIETLGNIGYGLVNVAGLTDGRTEAGKEELKETLGQLGIMLVGANKKSIKKEMKEMVKSNPKLFAEIEGLKAYASEFVRGLMGIDTRTLAEYLQRKKYEVEPKEKEGKITEGKEVKDVTPLKEQIGVKISKIAAIHNEAVRSAQAAYENAYMYSSVAKKGLTRNQAMENYKKSVEGTNGDIEPITKFEAKITEAKNKVTKEVSIEQQQKEYQQSATTIAQNIVEGFKQITQPKPEAPKEIKTEEKATKQIKREDVAMKKVKLTEQEQNTLRNNTLVPLLEEELFKHIKENRNKRGEITEYTQIDSPRSSELAEALLEPLYSDVKKILEVMGDWRKEIHDTIYATLPKIKNINLGGFRTEENLAKGGLKLAEFIENGEIGIFIDGKGKLYAKYTGGDTTQDVLVEASINALNEALDYYNEATKNGRVALSEKNIMDIQDRLNKIGYRETEGEGMKIQTDKARIGRELYRMFNNYLDQTNAAPTLRAGDKAMQQIHETLGYLEDLVKGKDEVKKNARARLLKLNDQQIAGISQFIPDIKDIIDLAKNGPQIIQKLSRQLLKTDFVHPINARIAKYGTMVGVAGAIFALAPGFLGKAAAIPVGTYLGNKIKAKFKQRPIKKTNKPLLDMLGLPEDYKKLMKQRERNLKASAASLSDRLRSILNPEKQPTASEVRYTQATADRQTPPQTETTLQRQQGGTLQRQPETPLSMIGLPDNRIKFIDDFIEDYDQFISDLDQFYKDLANEIAKEYENIKSTQGEKKAQEYVENIITDIVAEAKPENMSIDEFLNEVDNIATMGEERPTFSSRSNESLNKLFDKDGKFKEGVPEEYREEITNEMMSRDIKKSMNDSDIRTQNNIIRAINKQLDQIAEGKAEDNIREKYNEQVMQTWNVDTNMADEIIGDIVDGRITESDVYQDKTSYESNQEASERIKKRTGKETKATKSASKTSSLEVWDTKPDSQGKLNALKTQLATKKKATPTKKRQEEINKLEKEIARLEEKLNNRELDEMDIEAQKAIDESIAEEEKLQVQPSEKIKSELQENKVEQIPADNTNKRKGKQNVEKFDETFKGDEMEENADGEVTGKSKEVKMREYVKDNFKSVKSNAEAVVEDRYNIQLIKTKLAHNTNIESKDLNVLFENKQIDADILGQFNRGNVSIKLGNRGLKYTEAHEYGHYLDCKFSKELLGGEGGRGLSYMIEKGDISKLDSTKKQLINEFKTIKEQIDKKLPGEEITEEKFARFAEEFTKRVEGDKSEIFNESLFKEYTNWLSNMAEARAKGQLNNGTLKPSLEGMIWDMNQRRLRLREDLPEEMKKQIDDMIKERGLEGDYKFYIEKITAINRSIEKGLNPEDLSEADKRAYKLKDDYIRFQVETQDQRLQDYGDAKSDTKIGGGTKARFRKLGKQYDFHLSGDIYKELKEKGLIISPEEYEAYIKELDKAKNI